MKTESDIDILDLTTWLDEADRALGDCLERIERAVPDCASNHALRSELLFLLRAARTDLVTHFLDSTSPLPQDEVDEVRCQ